MIGLTVRLGPLAASRAKPQAARGEPSVLRVVRELSTGDAMLRIAPLFAAVVGLVGTAGCKSTQSVPEVPGEIKPALLIGPDATSKAAPPVELPAKESGRLCLRAAQEFEKTFEQKGQDADLKNAIQLFEKARANDAAHAKLASRRLAVLYDKAGEFQKATAEYEALIKANPKDADLLTDLGYSYYCRGDWANAEAYLAKAVQLDPNHKKAWINLGLALAQQAKWDESFQAFCQSVRPADAHCNIAFVLAVQGNTAEAKAQYRQALALDPASRLARAALARLDNPEGRADGSGRRREKFDPAIAAAQVPSIAELEARMKQEAVKTPVVTPLEEAKPSDAQ
jgi:tetratricopeptide (TPR) repeat protein